MLACRPNHWCYTVANGVASGRKREHVQGAVIPTQDLAPFNSGLAIIRGDCHISEVCEPRESAGRVGEICGGDVWLDRRIKRWVA